MYVCIELTTLFIPAIGEVMQSNFHFPQPLIQPSQPTYNSSRDNCNYDLILFQGQKIDDSQGNIYSIEEWIGAGQFGQVYRCTTVGYGGEKMEYAIKISKSTLESQAQFQYEIKMMAYVCFALRALPVRDAAAL